MAMPLIPITLAWLFGIWSASRIVLPSIALGFAAGVAILGVILSWRAPKPRWIFILTLAVILGALRFNLAQPRFDQATLATYNDQPNPVVVEGVAAAEPDARDAYTNLGSLGIAVTLGQTWVSALGKHTGSPLRVGGYHGKSQRAVIWAVDMAFSFPARPR